MRYLIAVVIFLVSLNAFSLELPKNYYRRWGHTPLVKARLNGVEISMKSIRRYMKLGDKYYPIADITYTSLKGSEVQGNINEIAKDISRSFGRISWRSRAIENGLVLNAFWKMGNRDIQIMLVNHDKGFSVTSSSSRPGYRSLIKDEIQTMQEVLKNIADFELGTGRISVIDLIIPKAFAQQIPVNLLSYLQSVSNPAGNKGKGNNTAPIQGGGILNNPNGLPNGVNNSSSTTNVGPGGLTTTVVTHSTVELGPNATKSIDDLNGNLQSAVNLGNSVDGKLSDPNSDYYKALGFFTDSERAKTGEWLQQLSESERQKFQQMIDYNFAQTEQFVSGLSESQREEFQKMIDHNMKQSEEFLTKLSDDQRAKFQEMIDKNIANIEELYGSRADRALNQVDRALDQADQGLALMKQAMDPKHMAILAFATAAGATLGTVATNLVISGVQHGLAFLWELITQKKAKAMRWEDFVKAREKWEEVNSYSLQLEKSVDLFLRSFDQLDKYKGMDLLQALRGDIGKLQFWQEEYHALSRDRDSYSQRCRLNYSLSSQRIMQNISSMQEVIKAAEDNGVNAVVDETFFCDQLATIKRKIVESENMINNLRLKILNGQREYADHFKSLIKQEKKMTKRINTFQNEVKRANKRVLSSIMDSFSYIRKMKRKKFLQYCTKPSTEYGKAIAKKFENYYFYDPMQKRRAVNGECLRIWKKIKTLKGVASKEEKKKFKDDISTTIDVNYSEAKRLIVHDNPQMKGLEFTENLNWFNQLRTEAHCFGSIESLATQQKCAKVAPHMFSLHATFLKAQKTYKNRCQENYEGYLKKLTENRVGNDERAILAGMGLEL
jgi:hypothetical protein